MMVAFVITEITSLVVSLFCNLVLSVLYSQYICGIKFFGCVICFVLSIVTKAAMASLKSFTIFS